MNYTVKWVIDVEADSSTEAAKQALKIQRDEGSTATVFVSQTVGSSQVKSLMEMRQGLYGQVKGRISETQKLLITMLLGGTRKKTTSQWASTMS